MNTIIEYLQNPMKVGVYNHKLVVDFSGFSDYLKTLIEKHKELYEKIKGGRRKIPKQYLEERLSKLREIIEQLEMMPWHLEGFFKEVVRILMEFSALEGSPEDLSDLFTEERIFHFVTGRIEKTRIRMRKPPVVFESHTIPEAKDVFSIEKSHLSDKKWLFDIVTI